MHDIFSDWCRSAILYCLTEIDDPISVSRLTENVVSWAVDCDGSTGALTARSDRGTRTVIEEHLSAMAAFGIINFDRTDAMIGLPDDVSITVMPPWKTDERLATAANPCLTDVNRV